MREQEGVNGCKSIGVEPPLCIAADPLAGTMLSRRKRIAEIWCGAIDGTGIDHHGGAVGQDQQGTVAAIGGDLVDFKNAWLPCGEGFENGCRCAEKLCGKAFKRGKSKRTE